MILSFLFLSPLVLPLRSSRARLLTSVHHGENDEDDRMQERGREGGREAG